MTSDAFAHWLAHCGRLLGLSADTIVRLKYGGADVKTALACQALMHGLKPYNP
jgi:hypothetical protein